MERYQVKIAYDGTSFQGFQRQGSHRTVQGVLEEALNQLGWQGRTILYAGRTDTGVHAAGQVIAFDLEWNHSTTELGKALNARLPEDTTARDVRIASPNFHPRYDALGRTYRYRIYCQEERDPLRERYAWRVWPAPHGDLLEQAARTVKGTHDFAAFGSPMKPGGSTVRTVYGAGWEQAGDEWRFEVTANAFLYRMVRRLVFIQIQAGLGLVSVEKIASALEKPARLKPGLAKPNGLVLENVYYAENGLMPEGLTKPLTASGEEDCG